MRYISILFGTVFGLALGLYGLALALAPAPIEAEYWVPEAIYLKRTIALQNQGRPQIIIVGGSSVLFGIDARQMTEQLGTPVVNFGLHAALKLDTLLDEADSAARPGDTVILVLEWVFFRSLENTEWQYRNIIAWEPDRWNSLSLFEKAYAFYLLGPRVADQIIDARYKQRFQPSLITKRLRALDERTFLANYPAMPKSTEFHYAAENLDEFGNIRLNEGTKPGLKSTVSPEVAEANPATLRVLQQFVDRMKAKDVAVYFAEPPYIASPGYHPEKIAAASQQFAEALAPVGKVLGDRTQLVFDVNFFYDTSLHLNTEGRRQRTQTLIDAIKKDSALSQRLKGH